MRIYRFKIVIFLLLLFITNFCPAEDYHAKEIKVDAMKPYRIEVNIGVPSILGLSFEWVLPFYVFKSHRLAIDLDFSYIPYFSIKFDPGYAKFTNIIYSGLFIKYYFNKKGRGLYVTTGSGIAHLDIETESEVNDFLIDNFLFWDIPLKIGVKWLIRNFILQFQAGTGFRLQYSTHTEFRGESEPHTYIIFRNSFDDFPDSLIEGIVLEISIGGCF